MTIFKFDPFLNTLGVNYSSRLDESFSLLPVQHHTSDFLYVFKPCICPPFMAFLDLVSLCLITKVPAVHRAPLCVEYSVQRFSTFYSQSCQYLRTFHCTVVQHWSCVVRGQNGGQKCLSPYK